VIKENVDGVNGEDNRVVDLQTGTEQVLTDPNGASGHSDMGFGYLIAEDNFNRLPGAVRRWNLSLDMTGLIVQGVGLPQGAKAPSTDFDAERIAYWFEQRAPQALPSPEPWPAVGTEAARFERKVLTYPAAKGPAAIANVRLAKLAAGWKRRFSFSREEMSGIEVLVVVAARAS
jgi:hypothetical protein